MRCDSPTNIERRDYLRVEHQEWNARSEIGDIPVTGIAVDYGPGSSSEVEKTNVDVQREWLVLSPRAPGRRARTGHDIANEDPQLVIDEIARVLATS